MKASPITYDAYKLLHDGSLAIGAVERQGLCIDIEYCETMVKHLERRIKRLEDELHDSDFIRLWKRVYSKDFNLKSPEQLTNVLYNPRHMGLEPIGFTDGDCNRCKGEGCDICHGVGKNPSTDGEALLATGIEGVEELIQIRKLTKIKDTYLSAFLREQVNGVVHPFINLNIARTYRPSTDSPNMANIPKRDPESQKICRKAIIPRPGHKILSADFKGIEVGIAACYNRDPMLMKYVADKKTDMHRDMAVEIYILDFLAKNKEWWKTDEGKAIRHSSKNQFVFPEFYGDYWRNCARALWASAQNHKLPDGVSLMSHLAKKGIRTLEQFEKHVEKVEYNFWNKRFSVYTTWKEEWRKAYYEKGYFDSLTGFRYQGVMDRNQIINYPIQGSAFHCLLQCLIWIVDDSIEEDWDSRVCNQIYDDLMMDIHPDEEEMVKERIVEYMTVRLPKHWPWIIVPLEVEIECTPIDGSWCDKED